MTNQLIYHMKDDRWVYLWDCVWQAPPCLRKVYALSSDYSSCEDLFRTKLNVGNSTIDHVITEILDMGATSFSDPASTVFRRKTLIFAINDLLRLNIKSPIDRLSGKDFIPKKLSLSTSLPFLYVADQGRLWRNFYGRLDLIDFSPDEIKLLAPLLSAIGLCNSLLSKVVKETQSLNGTPTQDLERTNQFRTRIGYIHR